MFNKVLPSMAIALAATNLVSAQTYTDCNPLKETCPADPAFGKDKTSCDFANGECSAFKVTSTAGIDYDKKGAKFTIKKETHAPTIATGKYIFYGRVDVEAQAAPGQGIVTSIVLQSDTLDEIDWEWLGGDATQVQSNYFSKGDTTTYDRGAFHEIADPLTTFHKYSIEWNKNEVQWIIDGKTVRTLKAAEVKGFPESPMQVKMGTWCAGGSETEEGTVMWAGGRTDFSKAPFDAYYKSVSIVDYAGGDSPATKSVKEYVYGDKSGSADSIKVKYGSSSDADEDEEEETISKGDQTKPVSTATRAGGLPEENKERPVVYDHDSGIVGMNFTATPVGTPTPGSTGSSGKGGNTEIPQSAASRSVAQGGLVVGLLLLIHLTA
ncbi:hypothetical protein FSARC_157 [Fusarium sarcochroum]|uniref:GH16 domain-containing protein n=1 Tax=Fusarium sarcochroum TaxID=1208366 RepID=A0A8H4UCL4_9HYPO|nr:hypothetical protein FSARC_157 [Fusarium sarcochroum]